ncbi:hypothetical protein D3C80_2036220 [compost metagenome]
MLQRLIGREAGAVRSQLEQDAVRLTEVQGPEVKAVHKAGIGQLDCADTLDP